MRFSGAATLIVLSLSIVACQSSAPPAPATPAAPGVDPATAGAITAVVKFEGTAPTPEKIRLDGDAKCVTANGAADRPSESIVLGDQLGQLSALQNVFVYIKDGLGNKYIFDTPTEPVKLDQKGCHYLPHVVGLRTTQPLEVINSDNTMHNVHGMPETNREFNQGQPVIGMKNTVTFTAPEVLIRFKCDVHAWMYAYVGVVSHPYFAVSGDGGAFELRTIPPGTYTIEAVHEKLGRQTQTVTLGDKDAKESTFTFKPAA